MIDRTASFWYSKLYIRMYYQYITTKYFLSVQMFKLCYQKMFKLFNLYLSTILLINWRSRLNRLTSETCVGNKIKKIKVILLTSFIG